MPMLLASVSMAASELPTIQPVNGKAAEMPAGLPSLYRQQDISCEVFVQADGKGKVVASAVSDCVDGARAAALSAVDSWSWPANARGMTTVRFVPPKKAKSGASFFVEPRPVVGTAEGLGLRAGEMPKYPKPVRSGDPVCQVSVQVSKGRTQSFNVFGCPSQFVKMVQKSVGSWTWHGDDGTIDFGIGFLR